ncbi:MAG: OmpA family protein [Bacteroidales bacterium]|nr:OmpA family protein [Bacteroidales bacterium]MBR1799462.1 OmpA family protein [Bacteroidales bacterium]
MKRSLYVFLAVLLTTLYVAQGQTNLVFNSSFEEHGHCPRRIDALGIMAGVEAWWQPTLGSSDYFNSCGTAECGVPRNKMGYQNAHSGQAYCGIYCSQENYREYIQTELKQPLVDGHRYAVSFYVSLSEKSPHATSSLSALFTRDMIFDSTYGILLQHEDSTLSDRNNQTIAYFFEPQITNKVGLPLSDKKEWMQIADTFIASGGERFLTIGNFASFNQSNIVDVQSSSTILPGVYYYIDDVCVYDIDDTNSFDSIHVELTTDSIVVIENIHFPVNQSILLPQSYRALQMILTMLKHQPSLRIKLQGHTDNTGTVEGNLRLSQERADAIRQYLIQHGIEARRIQAEGMGESHPLQNNDTPEGRAKNRRVELHIL